MRAPLSLYTTFAKNGVELWGPQFSDPVQVEAAFHYWVAQGRPLDVDIYVKDGALRVSARNPPAPPFANGDRIVLEAMSDDPDPIQPGTVGVVEKIDYSRPAPASWIVAVRWEDGRVLNLVMPPDRAKKCGSVV